MKIPWPFTDRRAEALGRQADALSQQMQAMADRLAALEAQTAANSAAHTALTLAERLLEMEVRAAEGRAAVEALAGKLSELAQDRAGDRKTLEQLRTAVLRIEAQAAIDAEEARRAAAALLERMEAMRAERAGPSPPRRRTAPSPSEGQPLPAGSR